MQLPEVKSFLAIQGDAVLMDENAPQFIFSQS